ncbi:uncharacterized protein BJX67DRAFT_359591 [Aspergillus lucknowensis]|uniref:Uncharacterized protein n=1 Tax=Aspergillus lucknowensis TaxID=176173 RepID=A0ABR4LNL5_9EURO
MSTRDLETSVAWTMAVWIIGWLRYEMPQMKKCLSRLRERTILRTTTGTSAGNWILSDEDQDAVDFNVSRLGMRRYNLQCPPP